MKGLVNILRVAICDDEETVRELIEKYLLPFVELGVVKELRSFNSGEAFLKDVREKNFDLVYLDIEMHGISGVQVAKKLRERNDSILIIFITSHVEFVSDTFRVGAFQFLRKPIEKEFFCEEFVRAITQYKINHHIYEVQTKNEIMCFEIEHILYIESYYGKLNLHMFGATPNIEFSGKLSIEEDKLAIYGFFKCHQGFLVNIQHIQKIGKDNIMLNSNETIPMSRRKGGKIIEAYHNYLFCSGI